MQLLMKQIQHIDKIFNGVVNISKKMYNQSDFYFVYAEAQRYTDRKEFVDIFKNNIYFLSNSNKDYTSPITDSRLPITNLQTKIPTRNLGRIDQITKHIQDADSGIQNIFIFSPKKEESKKIFEDLCQKDIHKDRLFLVENITGGVGKNVFKAT
jgi:superfamily II DNA or RNA helicase